MATLPATGYIANAARTNAEQQTALEALRDVLSQIPASAEAQLTIASGAVIPATRDQGAVKIETEAAAASDDLATIAQTNTPDGALLLVRAAVAGHTVVVKHAAGGAGQILLQYDADFSLNATDKWLLLKRVGTSWEEVFRSYGNDAAGERSALGFKAAADIASAATLDLSTAVGWVSRITGTTATTAVTMASGQWHLCVAAAAWPLTHHATNLNLNNGGSNYTCAAGDRVLFVKDNSGVVQATVFKADGTALAGGSSGVASGTISPYAGVAAPSGWLFAYGQAVSRSTYATLFSALVASATATFDTATDTVTWTAHPLENNDPVKFTTSGSLPGGISAGTTYYVRDKAANTFRLCAAPGGSAIDLTGTPSGTHTAIHAPFGDGDGSTTFNLPDLRGRVAVGRDDLGGSAANRMTSAGSGISGNVPGASGGTETHTLTTAQMPSHTHTTGQALTGSGGSAYVGSKGGQTTTTTTGSAGSGNAHQNTQPSLVVKYIIKT